MYITKYSFVKEGCETIKSFFPNDEKNIKFLNEINTHNIKSYKISCKRYFSRIDSNPIFSDDKRENVIIFLYYYQKVFILNQIYIIKYLIRYIILYIKHENISGLFESIKKLCEILDNEYNNCLK